MNQSNATSRFIRIIALFIMVAISSATYLIISSFTNAEDPGVAPDPNRFTKVVLTEPGKLDEPMEMTFLPGNRILLVERKGGVKIVDGNSGAVKLVATIPVNTKYKNKQGVVREAEEGLMGVIAHPQYAQNHWIYMYYADPTDTKHVLARWELVGDELVAASKKVVLEVPTQREECCHTGGGMVFEWDLMLPPIPAGVPKDMMSSTKPKVPVISDGHTSLVIISLM
jgi:cytochrome c